MAISGVYTTTQTARKQYTCDNCGLPILKGELYDREHYFMGPTFKFHLNGGLGGSGTGCKEAKQKAPS